MSRSKMIRAVKDYRPTGEEQYLRLKKGAMILLQKGNGLNVDEMNSYETKTIMEAFAQRVWMKEETLKKSKLDPKSNIFTNGVDGVANQFCEKGLIVIDVSMWARYLHDWDSIPFPQWIIFDPADVTWVNGKTEDVQVDDAGDPTGTPIAGMFFVCTGKGPEKRKDIHAKIERFGGRTFGNVQSSTDYLVVEDVHSQTTKTRAAIKKGIKIITYKELYDWMN